MEKIFIFWLFSVQNACFFLRILTPADGSGKQWLMDGRMENRNIVNYTILPANRIQNIFNMGKCPNNFQENTTKKDFSTKSMTISSLLEIGYKLNLLFDIIIAAKFFFDIFCSKYLQVSWKLFSAEMIYVWPSVPVAQFSKMDWQLAPRSKSSFQPFHWSRGITWPGY